MVRTEGIERALIVDWIEEKTLFEVCRDCIEEMDGATLKTDAFALGLLYPCVVEVSGLGHALPLSQVRVEPALL